MENLLQISSTNLILLGECFLYFLIGIVEAFLADLNILFLNQKHKSGCFITSVLNTVIFYTVIITIIKNEQSFLLICANGCGMGAGEILAIIFYDYLTKLAKTAGKSLKKFQKRYFIKKVKR
jgi:hypothetical protein